MHPRTVQRAVNLIYCLNIPTDDKKEIPKDVRKAKKDATVSEQPWKKYKNLPVGTQVSELALRKYKQATKELVDRIPKPEPRVPLDNKSYVSQFGVALSERALIKPAKNHFSSVIYQKNLQHFLNLEEKKAAYSKVAA
jgi:hypothetical protein